MVGVGVAEAGEFFGPSKMVDQLADRGPRLRAVAALALITVSALLTAMLSTVAMNTRAHAVHAARRRSKIWANVTLSA